VAEISAENGGQIGLVQTIDVRLEAQQLPQRDRATRYASKFVLRLTRHGSEKF